MKKYFALFLAAMILTLNACSAPSGEEKSETDKPNVILILIDDLSYFGVSAYGSTKIMPRDTQFDAQNFRTPCIDTLAMEGALCTQAYTHPVCEPTRVALMTGQHNGRNYIVTKALHHSQITFGDVFKRAGYATGMYGKWKQSRGTKEIPGEKYISQFGWDDYACFDVVTADQRFFNPDLVINDEIVRYKDRTDKDPRTGRRWFGPDIFNYKALDFIEKHKDEPFFLYYPMALIHDPHKPMPIDGEAFETCEESIKVDKREFGPSMIYYADELIGNIRNKVNELGIREKTLIIVMGDNGNKEFFTFEMEDGTVHAGGKGRNQYHGEQVPFIVSLPGSIEEGSVYNGIIDVTDVYPSVFDYCGIEMPYPEYIDGVSFWPQLSGQTNKPHRKAIYRWHNAFRPMDDTMLLVRFAQTPEFKYYRPHENYPNGRFFDLRTDRKEYAGVQGTKLGWEKYFFSGLDLNSLDGEQQEAYEMLKHYTDSMDYVGVDDIKIFQMAAWADKDINESKVNKQKVLQQTNKQSSKSTKPDSNMNLSANNIIELTAGQKIHLSYKLTPSNATMTSVIWVSNNPEVATIDKFGTVTAIKSGKTTITGYSWDDAWPRADNKKLEYFKDGVKDELLLTIK